MWRILTSERRRPNGLTCPVLTATGFCVVNSEAWSQIWMFPRPRKRFEPDEIIQQLREAEVLLSHGKNVAEACRQIGATGSLAVSPRLDFGVSPNCASRLAGG